MSVISRKKVAASAALAAADQHCLSALEVVAALSYAISLAHERRDPPLQVRVVIERVEADEAEHVELRDVEESDRTGPITKETIDGTD